MNNTTTAGTRLEVYKLPKGETVFLTILNSIGCSFGTTANLLVLLLIWNITSLKTNRNFLLASLTFSDFLSCVVWQPLLLDGILNGVRLDLKIVTFSTFFVSLASLNSLVLLTAERYVAVHYPFRYIERLTTKLVVVVSLISYGLALVLTTLVTTQIMTIKVIHYYIVFVALAILIIYIKIYITARKKARSIVVLTVASPGAQVQKTFPKGEKTTVSVGIVVGLLLLSWLPYLLIPLVPVNEILHVFPWINTCAVLQSNINPFIYFWRFEKFRRGLRRLKQRYSVQVDVLWVHR